MIDEIRGFLRARSQSYRLTFKGLHGERVLGDLARFCRAHETTFTENDRTSALLEGRREVWNRIARHMNMTDEELWNYYNPEGE